MTEEDYIKVVCSNIRRIRIEKGIKQIEVSYICDIDKSNLRRIESGKTAPSLKTLCKISFALKISIKELFPEDYLDYY